MSTAAELLTNREYKYGFVTDIETETIAKGLSEDTIRLISSKKNEPEWMLEFRLKAFRQWLKMTAAERLGEFRLSGDRFSEHLVLFGPEGKGEKGEP